MLSKIRPEDDELVEPVTEFSIFFLSKNLNNPRNPKTTVSLKLTNFLFGTVYLVSSLLKWFIFSIKCLLKAPPPVTKTLAFLFFIFSFN